MLNKMNTGKKIMAGFAIAVAIFCVVGILSFRGLTNVFEAGNTIATVRLPSIQALLTISEAQTAVDGAENALLCTKVDKSARQASFQAFENAKKRADDAWKIYEPLPQTAEEAAIWKNFVPAWEKWWKDHEEFVRRAKDYDAADAGRASDIYDQMVNQALVVNVESFGAAEKLLNDVVEINTKQASEESKAADATMSSTKTQTILGIGIGLVVCCLLGFYLARSIGKNLSALIGEAKRLAQAAVDGQLSTRGNVECVSAEFQPIVAGVNTTLDAVIGPLNVAAKYVDQISKGDIPAKITDTYNGDFNVLKNNLNQCIDAVNLLVADANMLAKAAVGGKLATRADATKHQGDYNKIVQGVNDTLDAVVGPINEAADVLSGAANKDLTKRVKGDYKGQLGELKENINRALGNLDDALTQVAQAVEQVTSASNQISSSSQGLAEGASEQASSLEEISSSLEEMASMTKQNADNAMEGKKLSEQARGSADKGNEAMTRMGDAINKIKTSSDQTAKIIKTIDEIAFQTNLLALNAAVEAARAGEAGKGFAVVAEEVRNLAQRSAEAAKNTANMIEESVKNAENGVHISQEVAKNLLEITEGAGKVNALVAEIAAASTEQSQGIDQVNVAVAQMDQVTQQNAAGAEESASAAEELNGQSIELSDMVGKFKLSVEKKATRGTTATAQKPGHDDRRWASQHAVGGQSKVHNLLHAERSSPAGHLGQKKSAVQSKRGPTTSSRSKVAQAEEFIPLLEEEAVQV